MYKAPSRLRRSPVAHRGFLDVRHETYSFTMYEKKKTLWGQGYCQACWNTWRWVDNCHSRESFSKLDLKLTRRIILEQNPLILGFCFDLLLMLDKTSFDRAGSLKRKYVFICQKCSWFVAGNNFDQPLFPLRDGRCLHNDSALCKHTPLYFSNTHIHI